MPIEATLSDKQKENLEEGRRMLGLRSRAEVFRWFADNVVKIVELYQDRPERRIRSGPQRTREDYE